MSELAYAQVTQAEEIRRWMIRVLERHALTPAAWARNAGLSPSTVQRAIKPEYQFITSTRTLTKLANAVGETPPRLDQALPEREPATFLKIRHEVGAGLWRMVDSLSQTDLGEAPVLADPAYSRFPQWLERVVGDSMNLEYPPGSLLHVVDAVALGYAPRAGDHVIVERVTEQGGKAERTVKEVSFGPSGIQLIARSTNPEWADNPVVLVNGQDQEHCTVEIRALVLGSYRSRKP